MYFSGFEAVYTSEDARFAFADESAEHRALRYRILHLQSDVFLRNHCPQLGLNLCQPVDHFADVLARRSGGDEEKNQDYSGDLPGDETGPELFSMHSILLELMRCITRDAGGLVGVSCLCSRDSPIYEPQTIALFDD